MVAAKHAGNAAGMQTATPHEIVNHLLTLSVDAGYNWISLFCPLASDNAAQAGSRAHLHNRPSAANAFLNLGWAIFVQLGKAGIHQTWILTVLKMDGVLSMEIAIVLVLNDL